MYEYIYFIAYPGGDRTKITVCYESIACEYEINDYALASRQRWYNFKDANEYCKQLAKDNNLKDDNNNMIYAGDTVEVNLPWETGTSYKSLVYWDRLDGAFVNPHPAHIKMGHTNHRRLSDFLGKKEHKSWIYTEEDEEDKFDIKYTKCIKVKSFYHN